MAEVRRLPNGYGAVIWPDPPVWGGEVRTPDNYPIWQPSVTGWGNAHGSYPGTMGTTREQVLEVLADRARSLPAYDPEAPQFRKCTHCGAPPGAPCRDNESTTNYHAARRKDPQ